MTPDETPGPRDPGTPSESLDGRRIVVTGGNAGLGYFTAELLARRGARVTIAARNAERAERAAATIRELVPGAAVDLVRLDLADLASVRDAAAELASEPIDGIVLNAGVLPWERTSATKDGFEPVFGTNQLGHFALLAQIFPALTAGAGIVSLGSLSHVGQRLRLDDLMSRRGRHTSYGVYGRSKLAVMTTAIELDQRVRAAGLAVRSVIAHPGYATDATSPSRPGITVPSSRAYAMLVRHLANSKLQGAEINVHALIHGQGGECWGPDGWFFHLGGRARIDRLRGPVLDPETGAKLWTASEELTGVAFPVR